LRDNHRAPPIGAAD